MLAVVLLFAMGLVLMVKGGDSFVDGAWWIAQVTGIPPFIIAATIVSVATTMPELMVSALAAAQGSGQMALGNAIGSVSCNTGFILGISLIFLPGEVEKGAFRDKGGLMAFAAIALAAFAIDGRLTWSEGIFLLILLAVFLKNNLDWARRSVFVQENQVERGRHAAAVYLCKFIFGAVGLAAGARLLVDNGSVLARFLGVPESVIALTLIALGTSLPELVTTLTALAKRQPSLSVGNIMGANFLDMTMVPAVSAFAAGGTLPMERPGIFLDLGIVLLLFLVMIPPALVRGRFRRWQGAAMMGLYGGYVLLLFR
jgi:cation:H+ antiporter